ncbi:MAG: bifunctional 5,10-methylenetetrahydrofolate dehydrogenase/5,10-methenyltetrahydrofolate cyclohydrolase [Patescibacteria group bacterium]|jgi:methylenetetrahydrofolate dehydrogenase (NADP+)/methenyltetrahydrofolate cyclohydrolase
MKIIDGQFLADSIKQKLAIQVHARSDRPGLAIILVGDDPGSHVYVNLKKRAAEYIGIDFHLYTFAADAKAEEIEQALDWLNADDSIDGILIQLPLPSHLDEDKLVARIAPTKDADGFHPLNIKRYLAHEPDTQAPGLIEGIMILIQQTQPNIKGLHAAVCANSSIFALPLTEALEQQGAQVTTFLRPMPSDAKKMQSFDIIILAVGKKYFLEAENAKNDAMIIDVGYNRDIDGISGDAHLDSFHDTDVAITPVPGGVGPMTVAILLKRVTELHDRRNKNLILQ